MTEDFKEKVKAGTDLYKLISEYTELKCFGRGKWLGRCPFPGHDDKNASFQVTQRSDGSWFYYCHVCDEEKKGTDKKKSRDCFDFMRDMYPGLSFPAAVKRLGDRLGLRDETSAVKDNMLRVQENIMMAAHKNLSSKARNYLHGRGVSDESIENWLIGSYMSREPVEDNEWSLVDRIYFPLLNGEKKCLGYSARKYPEDTRQVPKYINSRTSEIFNKNAYLYGMHKLDKNFPEIRIAEGAMDAVLAHQHGVRNVVATLSHALTEKHVNIIRSLKMTPVLCYDGDDAGRRGIEKAAALLASEGIHPKVFILPEGMDMAEYSLMNGEKTEEKLEKGSLLYGYWRLMPVIASYDARVTAVRSSLRDEVAGIIAAAQTDEERKLIIRMAKERLGFVLI